MFVNYSFMHIIFIGMLWKWRKAFDWGQFQHISVECFVAADHFNQTWQRWQKGHSSFGQCQHFGEKWSWLCTACAISLEADTTRGLWQICDWDHELLKGGGCGAWKDIWSVIFTKERNHLITRNPRNLCIFILFYMNYQIYINTISWMLKSVQSWNANY